MATIEKRTEDLMVIREENPYRHPLFMVLGVGGTLAWPWFLWHTLQDPAETEHWSQWLVIGGISALLTLASLLLALLAFLYRVEIEVDRKKGEAKRAACFLRKWERRRIETDGLTRVVLGKPTPRYRETGNAQIPIYPVLLLDKNDSPEPPKRKIHPREITPARTTGEAQEIAEAIAEFLGLPVEDLTMAGEDSLLDHAEDIPELRPAPEGFDLLVKPGKTTIALPRRREQVRRAVLVSGIWLLGFGGLFGAKVGGGIFRMVRDPERELPGYAIGMLLVVLAYILVPGILFLWFFMQRVKITVSSRGVLPRLSNRRPIPFDEVTGIAAYEEATGLKKKSNRHIVAFRTKTGIWKIGTQDVELSREEAEWLRDTLARLIVAYRDEADASQMTSASSR